MKKPVGIGLNGAGVYGGRCKESTGAVERLRHGIG
jgi:hypothetical protein